MQSATSATSVTSRAPAAPGAAPPRGSGRPAPAVRRLLACGVVVGPMYVVAALAQGLTRSGFRLAHDDVSLLANGAWGWVQAANFVLSGAFVLACAAGMRATWQGSGSRWAPRLIAGYGIGLIGAGLFRADAANGFPSGTPLGKAAAVSGHGMLHFAFAGAGFACLVAAFLVLARTFSARGERGWARYSRVSGIAFLAGFLGVTSGSQATGVVLGFWAAVAVAWVWLALVAARVAGWIPRRPRTGEATA
jgi:hypothetical protein